MRSDPFKNVNNYKHLIQNKKSIEPDLKINVKYRPKT